ncbi:hypothetical protein PIB30_048945 [Stylosanthes scabra]|uniref:Uncharacterized protein n=1 Tax=Stylosanthes scabra TaxID=79078 RepID=A0ABU6ZFY5_9FABA|nr:hypothetical protein [Stylosanthes scabra]
MLEARWRMLEAWQRARSLQRRGWRSVLDMSAGRLECGGEHRGMKDCRRRLSWMWREKVRLKAGGAGLRLDLDRDNGGGDGRRECEAVGVREEKWRRDDEGQTTKEGEGQRDERIVTLMVGWVL